MTAPNSHHRLQDVAALLACLDQETADALLRCLPEEQQQQARAAALAQGEISIEQRRALSQDFCHALCGSSETSEQVSVQNSERVSEQISQQTSASAETDSASRPPADRDGEDPRDQYVNDTLAHNSAPISPQLAGGSLDQLAKLLQQEHPQTIAAVLSTLVPHRAARLMLAFPPGQQYEIVRRIAEMDRTDMESLIEVERELREQIEREDNRKRPANDGWQAVQTILMSADTTARRDIIHNLERFDTQLAGRLSGRDMVGGDGDSTSVESHYLTAVAFDRLADLDAVVLENIFRLVPRETSIQALAGASHGCLKDLMQRLPDDITERLRLDLAAIGPLRLGDIHQAQAMLVKTARRLADASAQRERDRLRLSA